MDNMNAIQTELLKLTLTKAAIKLAITDKGITNVGDVFSAYPDKIKEILGGGSNLSLDFKKLNYTALPLYLNNSFKVAENLLQEWDASINNEYKFQKNSSIIIAPSLTSTFTGDLNGVFRRCYELLVVGDMDFKNCTSVFNFFDSCTRLKSTGKLIFPKATKLGNLFGGDVQLEYVEELVLGNNGGIESSFASCSSLRYIVIKNIGVKETADSLKMSDCSNYGINSETFPNAKQSLIDSLITYSFDRSKYTTPFTVSLHLNTKAVLTQDEIAQITAKGYTLA